MIRAWLRHRAYRHAAQRYEQEDLDAQRVLSRDLDRILVERKERVRESARRIAEHLFATYRLASIITNAPDPYETGPATFDAVLEEAVAVATKIEDGLPEYVRAASKEKP